MREPNLDNIEKWITALEGGEFEQGTGKLAYSGTSPGRYCCLGVACEVAIANGVAVVRRENVCPSYVLYDDTWAHLPVSVMEWLGVDEHRLWSIPRFSSEPVVSGIFGGLLRRRTRGHERRVAGDGERSAAADVSQLVSRPLSLRVCNVPVREGREWIAGQHCSVAPLTGPRKHENTKGRWRCRVFVLSWRLGNGAG